MSKEKINRESLSAIQRKDDPNKSMQPPQFKLDASPVGPQKTEQTPPVASQGASTALPENLKSKFEKSMGADFSNVKIYPQSEKPVAAGALAFAQGNEIHFAAGKFDPNSKEGQKLIAHELTHTIQQGATEVKETGKVGGIAVNEDKSLEAEADKMAEKAVAGEKADSPVQKKTANSANGPVQRFKMEPGDIKKYPKFANFVMSELPKCINDARLVKYLNINGTNQGETARDIKKDLTYGEGPVIRPWSLPANKVSFLSNAGSETIRLSRGDIDNFEKNDDFNGRFHEMVLESNIMNGYTQFLDDQDGKDKWGKEGVMTEKKVYGGDIESVADAKDASYARFGKGTWDVTVESASTEKAHRLKVWNSDGKDGMYDAKAGSSYLFTNRKNVNLNFWVESNAGDVKDKKAWYRANMIKAADGIDNYIVRAEDGSDRGRNDVVVRVRKKS